MKNMATVNTLYDYVNQNEVVFQSIGNLVEVANEVERENRKELLSYFNAESGVEAFSKGHCSIKNDFPELAEWATEEDVLFLLRGVGVLICVPKRMAADNNLIAA